MKRALLIISIFCTLLAHAQKTLRPGKYKVQVQPEIAAAAAVADTVVGCRLVEISGYDKTLASRRESFFATNLCDSADVVWMSLQLEYFDAQGRPLHSRRQAVRNVVPAGQTRRIDIPSWDKQCVYYYAGSEPRRRVQAAAAPFTVRITVDSLALGREPR